MTDNAYRFWRRCRSDGLGNRVFLFKGDGLRRDRLINRTFPDNTGRSARRARASGDVALWLVQTDAFKDRVNNALCVTHQGRTISTFPTGWGGGFTMS
nr:terminase gpA endonuclease subunit [Escherichia coli]